jgi:hypothetical protein
VLCPCKSSYKQAGGQGVLAQVVECLRRGVQSPVPQKPKPKPKEVWGRVGPLIFLKGSLKPLFAAHLQVECLLVFILKPSHLCLGKKAACLGLHREWPRQGVGLPMGSSG